MCSNDVTKSTGAYGSKCASERVGIRLKRIRERLGLSLRQVEERSRQLAEKKQNPDYLISRGWLNNIENGTYTPSACKQYTLARFTTCTGRASFPRSVANLSDFGRDQAMFAPSKTQLATRVSDADDTRVVPMKSDKQFKLDRTNLLAKLGKIWGEVPIRLLQHLDLRNGVYGFVGLSERTCFPLSGPVRSYRSTRST